ncbi:MAG: alpha,alpha-trehalase TreF [Bacteroidales bacterium]|nr:alpha,alpha-trehalase TreF [Bacteroidales bacterium]
MTLKHKSVFFLPLFYFLCFQLAAYSQIDPADAFDSLFIDVQLKQVFSDQKKFTDCEPLYPPDEILRKYNLEKKLPSFNLRSFVAGNFDTSLTDTSTILNHIGYLWPCLTKHTDQGRVNSSLIPLPFPYIVPGGRFREMYYWDSYFTMLGLAESGKYDLIQNMTDNFCYLIAKFGHIPNGNRTYYLSRSQPPYFSLMIELLAKEAGDSAYLKYLNCMEQEYRFWMRGIRELNMTRNVCERVVMPEEDEILNRYWDSLSKPRPESYHTDVALFRTSDRDNSLYRNIRATAESGWDFSSRWLKGDTSMQNIYTTEILPVDLNCLLHHLEMTLYKCHELKGNEKKMSERYLEKAGIRKELINKYFWNDDKGFYFDYNFAENMQSDSYTLAGVFPLFFRIANEQQAGKVAHIIKERFLKKGGVVTTMINTGEQWDYPNGWAPLQWITYKGLKNYGYDALADSIARRWLDLNMKVFFETGKMMEKYDVVDINRPGGGGEYPLQDGFGWTNGVFLKLYNELNE